MMLWLLGPFYALFSLEFYRWVLRRPVWQAFVHFFVLTLIGVAALLFYIQFHLSPKAAAFVEWLGNEIPALTWTPDGFVMNARSPYLVVHPDLGLLLTFDMSRDEIPAEEIGEGMLYVTSKKVYVRLGEEEIRTYDVTRRPETVPSERLATPVDRELLDWFYAQLRPWLIAGAVVIFVPMVYFSKMAETLLLSAFAALINRSRRPPLPYPKLYLLTAFAITAATLIELRPLIWPVLGRIPFGLLGTLAVSVFYLFWAVRKTGEMLPEA